MQLDDAAALLAALAELQQLTFILIMDPAHGWPAAGPAYAAITASSKLQQLMLYGCQPPAGIWPHVFAPGKQLQELLLVALWIADDQRRGRHQHQQRGSCSARMTYSG